MSHLVLIGLLTGLPELASASDIRDSWEQLTAWHNTQFVVEMKVFYVATSNCLRTFANVGTLYILPQLVLCMDLERINHFLRIFVSVFSL